MERVTSYFEPVDDVEVEEFEYSGDTERGCQETITNDQGHILVTCEAGHEWFTPSDDDDEISVADAPRLKAQFYLDAALEHGKSSEPDHEVGDLQTFLMVAFEIMTPEQIQVFANHASVTEMVEIAIGE
jgi:hypothetical protein